MYSESKEPSRSGWQWPWGKILQCTVDGMQLPRQSWLTATYPALFSALNCHRRKLHRPGTACCSTHRMPANSPGLPPREQLITLLIKSIPISKNPMNTIMLSNFLDISKLSHSEYFYIFIRLLICQKIKKLSEENLYFIIFLTWLRAREKPTKKKKKVVVAIWCPIKTGLYYINN